MAAPVTDRVALVGLGNMGAAVAERLLDAGFRARRSATARRAATSALVERGATRLGTRGRRARARPTSACRRSPTTPPSRPSCSARRLLAGARRATALVEMSTDLGRGVRARRRARRRGAASATCARPSAAIPTVVRAGNADDLRLRARRTSPSGSSRCSTRSRPNVRYVGEGERARVVKLVAPGARSAAPRSCSPRRSCSARPPASTAQTLLDVIGASVVGSRVHRVQVASRCCATTTRRRSRRR